MRRLALLLLVPAALANGQTTTPAAPATTATAPAEKTSDQTASPELVGQLVSELGITPSNRP